MKRTISQVLANSLGSREVVPGLSFLYLGVTCNLASRYNFLGESWMLNFPCILVLTFIVMQLNLYESVSMRTFCYYFSISLWFGRGRRVSHFLLKTLVFFLIFVWYNESDYTFLRRNWILWTLMSSCIGRIKKIYDTKRGKNIKST